MERLGRFAGGRVRIGVSPHAPYTVSGPLYAATAAWAREAGLPIAVHLAESPAESALLASGTGAFADAWRARGIPMPAPLGRSPVAWLDEHGVLSERTLCIHVVQAGAGGRRSGSPRECGGGALPAVQPRARPRRRAARSAAGGGTPGGARHRLHHERRGPSICWRRLGRLARLRGSMPRERSRSAPGTPRAPSASSARSGVLAPGKWGDCVVIRTGAAPDASRKDMSAEDRVLASGPRDVLATFVGGRDVHRTSPPL